jgi:hypothetical protein
VKRGSLEPTWRKSSYSNGQSNCVELAVLATGRIALRDSRNPARGALHPTTCQWHRLLRATKAGQLDAYHRW